MKRLSAVLGGMLMTMAALAADKTPAARLLDLANAGKPASIQEIRREVSALYALMGVPEWMRLSDEPMSHWPVDVHPDGAALESDDHIVLLVRGPAKIRSIGYAVIVATGNVEIDRGTGLVVIAAGDIRFRHNPDRDWSGVFVSHGKVIAPWLANAVVDARRGLSLDSSFSSVGVVERSSPNRKSAGTPQGASAFAYAGKRCANGPALDRVAVAVPAIARKSAACNRDISLVIASCDRSNSAEALETWRVFLCENVLVDVSAKRTGGKDEFAVKPLR